MADTTVTSTRTAVPAGIEGLPAGQEGPRAEDISRCIHCGYCLNHCPTYVALGLETESPRGRIHLIDALSQGRIKAGRAALEHLDLCLQCRACETACPSGVRFGRIMEGGRAQVVAAGRSPLSWRLRSVALRWESRSRTASSRSRRGWGSVQRRAMERRRQLRGLRPVATTWARPPSMMRPKCTPDGQVASQARH